MNCVLPPYDHDWFAVLMSSYSQGMGWVGGLSFDRLSITIPVTTKYVVFVSAIDFPLYVLTQSLGESGQLRLEFRKQLLLKPHPLSTQTRRGRICVRHSQGCESTDRFTLSADDFSSGDP